LASQRPFDPLPRTGSEKFDLGLDIPQEIVLKKGTVVKQNFLFAYDETQFKLVLEIFVNYHGLAQDYGILEEQLQLTEEKNLLLEAEVVECLRTLKKVDKDRQFVYDLREKEQKNFNSELRKQRVKTLLWAGGGGLVGLGLGIVIGFFAIR
jgi:hypothetical protein